MNDEMRGLVLGMAGARVVDVGQPIERQLPIDLDRIHRRLGIGSGILVVVGQFVRPQPIQPPVQGHDEEVILAVGVRIAIGEEVEHLPIRR